MRGLQAREHYTAKNNSTSFSISLSARKPLLVGEINSRLVCLRLQEFAAVVGCVFVCIPVCIFSFILFLFIFSCWRKDGHLEVYPINMGVSHLILSVFFFLKFSQVFYFPFLFCFSPCSLSSALYLFCPTFTLCSSFPSFRGV